MVSLVIYRMLTFSSLSFSPSLHSQSISPFFPISFCRPVSPKDLGCLWKALFQYLWFWDDPLDGVSWLNSLWLFLHWSKSPFHCKSPFYTSSPTLTLQPHTPNCCVPRPWWRPSDDRALPLPSTISNSGFLAEFFLVTKVDTLPTFFSFLLPNLVAQSHSAVFTALLHLMPLSGLH